MTSQPGARIINPHTAPQTSASTARPTLWCSHSGTGACRASSPTSTVLRSALPSRMNTPTHGRRRANHPSRKPAHSAVAQAQK
jgi:hypothetical protein